MTISFYTDEDKVVHPLLGANVKPHQRDRVRPTQTPTPPAKRRLEPEHTESSQRPAKRTRETYGHAFEVKTSTIPNAGRGVFAKEDIPGNTIIGKYHGIIRCTQEGATL